MTGQGLSGTVRLAAAGRYQRHRHRRDRQRRADAGREPDPDPARPRPGDASSSIPTRRRSSATPSSPGSRSGNLFVAARARRRSTIAAATAPPSSSPKGRRGVPFRVAANAALAPSLIRAAAAGPGQQYRLPLRPARPQIARDGGDWRLAPVDGRAARRAASGSPAAGATASSSSRGSTASTSRSSTPSRPASASAAGRPAASISPRPADGSFPRAEARLNIAGFTRTGIAVRSSPVDIAFAGKLRPEGGSARRDHPPRRRRHRPRPGAAAAARPGRGRVDDPAARGAARRRHPL